MSSTVLKFAVFSIVYCIELDRKKKHEQDMMNK